MNTTRIPTGRIIAALATLTLACGVGAATANAGTPETPGVALLSATCYDTIAETGGAVQFTITNLAGGNGVAWAFIADLPGVGAFASTLDDGESTVGGFGVVPPGAHVLTVTNDTFGGSTPFTFVVDPCPPPTITTTSTTTTTTLPPTTTTTTTTTTTPTTLPATPTTDPPAAGILPATR